MDGIIDGVKTVFESALHKLKHDLQNDLSSFIFLSDEMKSTIASRCITETTIMYLYM